MSSWPSGCCDARGAPLRRFKTAKNGPAWGSFALDSRQPFMNRGEACLARGRPASVRARKRALHPLRGATQPEGLKRNSPRATPLSLATFWQASIGGFSRLPPPQAGLASAFTPRAAAGERLPFLNHLPSARLSGLPLFVGLGLASAGRLNADAARGRRFNRPLKRARRKTESKGAPAPPPRPKGRG